MLTLVLSAIFINSNDRELYVITLNNLEFEWYKTMMNPINWTLAATYTS